MFTQNTPKNPYMFFFIEQKHIIKKNNPYLNNRECMREIANTWINMNKTDKQKYIDLAAEYKMKNDNKFNFYKCIITNDIEGFKNAIATGANPFENAYKMCIVCQRTDMINEIYKYYFEKCILPRDIIGLILRY